MKLLKVDTISEVQEKLRFWFEAIERRIETVDLRNACGRYLAEEVVADIDAPSFRRSVVDGFAVRGADTVGVGDSAPVFLDVVGTVEMGRPADCQVGPGEAVYVPTGGMLPPGADAMVMIEHVDMLDDRTISVNRPAAPGTDWMEVGEDFPRGQVLFSLGHRVVAKDIGLLAACGKTSMRVFQRPRLSILSTGDEIVVPSVIPGPGQVRDCNAYAIAAFAEEAGAAIVEIDRVRDDFEAYAGRLRSMVEQSDLVVLSGGSSAGAKDFTAQAIDSLGRPGVVTHGLAIKPGKPTVVGILKDERGTKAVIGLPGHPLSSIIVFDVIVNGLLRTHYFGNTDRPVSIPAVLSENLRAGEGRETYQLVHLLDARIAGETGFDDAVDPGWIAVPIRARSGAISPLALADGYVVIPAGSEGIHAGRTVRVIPLRR